jgi:hypothetical protein
MMTTHSSPDNTCLADLKPQELRAWLCQRQKWLADHQRCVRRYLARRAQRHPVKTFADRQYIGFVKLADDLLDLLDGVLANVEQDIQQAESEEGLINADHE